MSAILGTVSLHFKSDNGEIWREGTDLGHPSVAHNFVKIARGICPLGEILPKKFEIFAIFS